MRKFWMISAAIDLMTFAKAQVSLSKMQEQKIQAAKPIIDSLFRSFAQENHLPGASYGIVANGQLLVSGHYGNANLENKIKADSDIDYRIASMSKSFTAMAILQLRDKGEIQLDAPASNYVSEMKNWKMLTTDAAQITVRGLLSHNAGFPEDNPWGDRQLALPDKDFLSFLQKGASFSHTPGDSYEYSNLAFAILGQIITNVSGQSYQQYITQQILIPLGMTHTYWEYDSVPADKLAVGYRWIQNQWVKQPMLHDGVYGAMGGLITTVEDFAQYMAFYLQAWPPRDGEEKGPIKRSSLREMQQPWNFNSFDAEFAFSPSKKEPTAQQYCYGLRWMIDAEGRKFVGHTGGLPGFGSHWYVMPDYGIGIVGMGNGTYAPMSKIDIRILDTLITIADLKKYVPPASPILVKRQNELIDFLPDWNKAEKSSIFAENFFEDYLINPLKQQTEKAFFHIGKINRTETIIPENALRGTFKVIGEKGNLWIKFTLSPEVDPKIQSFQIMEE